jgi:pimeloyl-ACP methyl ester carboxylesterase
MALRAAAACLGAVGLLVPAACRTAAPAGMAEGNPAPVAGPVDEDAVRALPGYRAEAVAAPVFGGEVFVMEAGEPSAATVVLVHGLGESGCRDFYPVLPALVPRYHVVALDLPGFGRSTHANELYSPERYAQFLHELLAARRRGRFNLVGHSMGGALSLFYAARFPADVERLVLIDAAGMLQRNAFVDFAADAALDRWLGPLAKPAKELATVLSESTRTAAGPLLPGGAPDPAVVLQSGPLRATVLGGDPTRIAALAVILENFGPAIDQVRAPTWILWGSNDAIASPRAGRVLRARLPAVELRVLDGSGHDPMQSRPAAVQEFLLGALSSPAVAPPKAAAAAALPSSRKGRCERQDGVRFSGDYAEIEVVGCKDVVLQDVRAASLRLRDSYAVVEAAQVTGADVALEVRGSRVQITASDFSGNVALDVEGSDLDLAGVVLRGRRASVHVGGSSRLVFSISHAASPINQRYLHGVYEFDIGAEL